MNSPVSILFPCYQINTWLHEALNSVEAAGSKLQSECVIIANNMSAEDLIKLQKICLEVLTIKYKIENVGVSNLVDALNFGIEKCSFSLIARMDQDDLMLPERLIAQRDYLDLNPNVAIVGGATQVIDEFGNPIDIQAYPCGSDQIRKQLSRGNCFAHPAVMYRKEAVQKVGLYSNLFTHAEDFDLFIRISSKYECANLNFPVIKYRLNQNQVSNRFRNNQIISTRSLIVIQGIQNESSTIDFPIPNKHADLGHWLKDIRNFSLRNYFSHNSKKRKRASQVRHAIARSHFAIARSSSTKKKGSWLAVLKHLTLTLFFSPVEFIKQVRYHL